VKRSESGGGSGSGSGSGRKINKREKR